MAAHTGNLHPFDEVDLFTRATAPDGAHCPMPPAAIVVAHPDDETIAVGARIRRFRDAHFIYITDGAPANGHDAAAHGFPSVDAYRSARKTELLAALRIGGIDAPHLHMLGIPDQQASLSLFGIVQRLAAILSEISPEVILTHPYEGGHPDHDACAFAVHQAVALNERAGYKRPSIIESPFYHATPEGMQAGTFVPYSGMCAERTEELTAEEVARKRDILACFITQRETLDQFPIQQERFRIAPAYDFTQLPHNGPILYDRFPWGVTSSRFLELAAAALAQLSPEVVACR